MAVRASLRWLARRSPVLGRVLDQRDAARRELKSSWPRRYTAYDPDLLPGIPLMQQEGVEILEEWCRGGEEWTMLLRAFGGLARDSAVLEIGCGLGRVAFALRFALSPEGRYRGFEICRYKVDFEQAAYRERYPNFEF